MQLRPESTMVRRGKDFLRSAGATVLRQPTIREAWIAYHRSEAAQSIISSTALLGAIMVLDVILGMPPAGRLLYFIPVFTITHVAGIRAGAVAVLIVSIIASLMDRAAGLGHNFVVNFIVRYCAMNVLCFKVESMVDRIKTTTDFALHDPLTGAFNRYGFTQKGDELLQSTLLDHRPLVVAVIDLDDFKPINDQYGHAFGDKILRTLVDCLRPTIANGGILGRVGGDEFHLLIPDITKEAMADALHRALNRFNDSTLVMGHRAGFSFGTATLREDGSTLEQIVGAADAAMYRRKSDKLSRSSLTTATAIVGQR